MSSRPKLKTTTQRSKLMSRVRQSGTSAELSARKLIRGLGIRFATKSKGLPGSPDLVNRSDQWAIFVHGCFWHAHKNCAHWKEPKHNRSFWRAKFQDNVERDKRKMRELKQHGFLVLVLWGCELRDESKARKKVLRFMKKVAARNARRNLVAAHSSGGGNDESISELKESFRCSNGIVIRTLEFGGKKLSEVTLRTSGTPIYHADPQPVFEYSYLRRREDKTLQSKNSNVRIADLFCGCGGLSLGAREACHALGLSFESGLAIDNESESMEVYRKNFRPILSFDTDIRSIIVGALGQRMTAKEKKLLRMMGAIDVLLAGPPCQGHSDLNNHTRRRDRRNELYEVAGRFAEIVAPRFILIENVPSVVLAHERVLERTMAGLSRCGYKIDATVVDLSAFGVPQKRRRHVLIASREIPFSIDEIVSRHRVTHSRNVYWAIGDLEREEPTGIFTSPSEHSSENRKRIEYLFRHDLYDLPDRMRPICHRNGHTYKSMYGRMKYDEPAQTITSGFGCPGQGRYIHPTQPRALTPHEAARLQFFPDFFDFSDAKTRAALANMIGNAVPMKLSYVFCLEFLIADRRSNSRS